MIQILCPHCDQPIRFDESLESERIRHEKELEIVRLQGELEQMCARFELTLRHLEQEIERKDQEIKWYQKKIDEVTYAAHDGIDGMLEDPDRQIRNQSDPSD